MLEGEGKHVAYRRLAELTDTFGHRKSGSEELERSIGKVRHTLMCNQTGKQKVEKKDIHKCLDNILKYLIKHFQRYDDFRYLIFIFDSLAL